jgi:hypothetical protein
VCVCVCMLSLGRYCKMCLVTYAVLLLCQLLDIGWKWVVEMHI